MQPGRPRDIRQLVEAQFAEIDANCQHVEHETLLIRDGQYCGHRYHAHGLTAVWFLEENQLKFFDAAGRMVRTLRPQIALDSSSVPASQRAEAA